MMHTNIYLGFNCSSIFCVLMKCLMRSTKQYVHIESQKHQEQGDMPTIIFSSVLSSVDAFSVQTYNKIPQAIL